MNTTELDDVCFPRDTNIQQNTLVQAFIPVGFEQSTKLTLYNNFRDMPNEMQRYALYLYRALVGVNPDLMWVVFHSLGGEKTV